MGYFITLYPMDNLVRESKKYGFYENSLFNRSNSKIVVVNVNDILNGRRIDIPISLKVLKEAERKYMSKQTSLDL